MVSLAVSCVEALQKYQQSSKSALPAAVYLAYFDLEIKTTSGSLFVCADYLIIVTVLMTNTRRPQQIDKKLRNRAKQVNRNFTF